MNKEIINDQKKTIHRLQQECTEKTNAIIALGEQLQAKEQECERLKRIINESKNSKLDLKSFLVGEAVQNEYEQQLDQLKAENEELKKINKANAKSYEKHWHKLEKYKQTLQEIKEIAEFSFRPYRVCGEYNDCCEIVAKILSKISEVIQ